MINKILDFFKANFKVLIIYTILIFVLLIEFPYYIEAPGGIINVKNRITISNSYESNGSFNLSYVSEYRANLINLLVSVFNKDWKVISTKELLTDNETTSDYELRDKIMLEESYANATFVGYTKANKTVEVINEELYVNYLFKDSNTTLQVGDKIIEVDNKKVNSKEEIDNIISNHDIGDIVNVKVLKSNKEYNRTATLIEYENKPIIGISVSKIKNLKTSPSIDINYKARESGPSGGLMLSLAIYNDLTEEDITNGLTIVGTGTIDEFGNVGSIGGVEYKLKGAVKSKADVFIVPNGDNYKDAIKLKEKNNYKITIIGVSTFDDALNYLKNRE